VLPENKALLVQRESLESKVIRVLKVPKVKRDPKGQKVLKVLPASKEQ